MQACTSPAARAAYRQSRWFHKVRIGRSGAVLEPASGAFDVTVAPGEDVQAAVDACPAGGCVLLQPGTHEGPLVLTGDGPRGGGDEEGGENWEPPALTVGKEVHVFGRGLATLRRAAGSVLISRGAVKATVDGLVLVQAAGVPFSHGAVLIAGGALRLQTCDVPGASDAGIFVHGGGFNNIGADPVIVGCKCAPFFFFFFLRGGGGRVFRGAFYKMFRMFLLTALLSYVKACLGVPGGGAFKVKRLNVLLGVPTNYVIT